MRYMKEQNELNTYFDLLKKELSYHEWFFGHFNEDISFDKNIIFYIERLSKSYN